MPSAPRPMGKASRIAYNILGLGENQKRKRVKKQNKKLDVVEGPILPKMK